MVWNGSGADSQVLATQGLRKSQKTACPQSCPNCHQADTIQDNAGHDGEVLLRLLLRVVQDSDDGGKHPRRSQTKGRGESLLEAIKLLVEMDPEERAALIGFLKLLG